MASKKSKKDLVLQLKPFYILKIQGQVQMEDIIKWKTPLLKFKDVAFSLQQGEISEPFETDFGIIYVWKKNQRTRNWITSYIIDSFSIWRSKLPLESQFD
jgi:hypothetical protein